MSANKPYFFCGIGGSGMLPLALILKSQGKMVCGSDRAYDLKRSVEKFNSLKRGGILMFPQDGSGVDDGIGTLVVSSAVEETIPDVRKALQKNIPIMKRADVLSQMFNAARIRIAVGGTSGKSTVTGMIGYILEQSGYDPTVMNGAVMKNYVSSQNPYAMALTGKGPIFVTEADESDGSISLYNPTVAVLNNIALDHKSMDELRILFGDFVAKAKKAVINIDNQGAAAIAQTFREKTYTCSFNKKDADFYVTGIITRADRVECSVHHDGQVFPLTLPIPGRHNLMNALMALAACVAAGAKLEKSVEILESFKGIKRRLEVVGSRSGITVIDDFGHNPDKIAATLKTLKDNMGLDMPGRLLLVFQPHGYGPLRLMGKEIAQSYADHMGPEDILFMPEVLYMGGTVDRSVGSQEIVKMVNDLGCNAVFHPARDTIQRDILKRARTGDRIVVMGARDDTLSSYAQAFLDQLPATA